MSNCRHLIDSSFARNRHLIATPGPAGADVSHVRAVYAERLRCALDDGYPLAEAEAEAVTETESQLWQGVGRDAPIYL